VEAIQTSRGEEGGLGPDLGGAGTRDVGKAVVVVKRAGATFGRRGISSGIECRGGGRCSGRRRRSVGALEPALLPVVAFSQQC
jgi:hypothetical protein